MKIVEQQHKDTLSQQTSTIKMAENFEGRFAKREDGEHMPAKKQLETPEINTTKQKR